MYTIIYDFLRTLLPSGTLTAQLQSWLNLASLTTLTLLYVFLVLCVIWLFKIFAGLFKW